MGNTPNVRFKGFTEDWEQRKLGDLVDRVTRKNQDLVSELPLTISAQYGLIDQNEFFDKRVASKDVSGYYLIENGEFAYNKSTSTDAPWGAIKRLDRYKNGVLSTLYILFGIKENNPVDSDFLVSYYSTNLWHKGIHEIAAEGARNHGLLNITPADFFETKLMIPQDIEEQKKIGKYFEELERLITLHQQKCDETKEFKKYMLQNMFPQKDEKVPKIRFDGFTGDWEQRKLSEISDFITKGATPTTYGYDWQESGIPFFRNDAIKDNKFSYGDFSYISEEANEALQRSEIHGDDILVAITGDIGKAGIVPKSIEKGNINQHTARVRIIKDAIPYFVYQSLITDKQQKKYQLIKTGLSMPQLSLQQIRDTIILCPSVEEQSMIGECFINLDNLITLHQQKCNALKEFKKYMLQNMFPQKGENKCQN